MKRHTFGIANNRELSDLFEQSKLFKQTESNDNNLNRVKRVVKRVVCTA